MATIYFPDGTKKQFNRSVSGRELVPYFSNIDEKKVVGLMVNNRVASLDQKISVRAYIAPVLSGTQEGSQFYRRTLCFILAAAAQKLYPKLRLRVGPSIGHGYYYTLEGEQAKDVVFSELETEMWRMVKDDLPIETHLRSYEEALEIFSSTNQPDTLLLVKQLSKPTLLINTLDGFSDLHFQPLLDRTGVISAFEIFPYGDGFLLRFPATGNPDLVPDFKDIPQLFTVYSEYKKWGKRIGVSSVAELNELISKRKIRDYIEITETMQNNKLANIAAEVEAHKNTRIILIAGPSSAGKTTTAKKLSMQLRVLGFDPHIISLDNFYRGVEFTPKDADGKPDFETLEALDLALLNELFVDLLAGKEVQLPIYDFKISARKSATIPLRLNERSILIVEGIHGLNSKLLPAIDADATFKIYLSALTQLNLDDHNRIPTTDNRLLRRIVRDSQFRNSPAARTIAMWASVRRGEEKHIFPHQDNANVMFNTALDYELAVLKVYADPVLREVKPTDPEYNEACRLLTFLNNFSPVSATYVPGQSLLREFIGESDFSYH